MVKYDFNRRQLLLKQYLRWLPAQLGLFNKAAFSLQIDEIRDTDVFFLSYPKSGNTWLRYIIATAMNHPGDITIETLKNYVPDVYIHKNKINNMKGTRFIKTHHAFLKHYPKTVYIYRNPFDVMVSFYHHAMNKRMFGGTMTEFLHSELLQKQFGSWADHVGSALKAKRDGANILILKYEDFLANPGQQITSLLNYLSIKPLLPISQIAEMTSFDHLKALENKHGSFFTTGEKFFRQGKQNVHPELSDSDKNFILSNGKAKELAIELGYVKE